MKKLDSNIWRTGRKCFFKNSVHLVFLTKHRNVLNKDYLVKLEKLFTETCLQMKCQLISFSGSPGHVYLHISIHPTLSISKLAGTLKSRSSYLLVKEFSTELKDKIVKNHFWSSSYLAVSGEQNHKEIIETFLKNDSGS
jgi:putative transposase